MDKIEIKKIAGFVSRKIRIKPVIGIILGSGLGGLTSLLEKPVVLPYSSIPGFPKSRVKGHANALHAGVFSGVPILLFSGRFHFYEGFPMEQVTTTVRLANALGIQNLLVTNAAGGINRSFGLPSIMIIKDHINLMGTNPLIAQKEVEFSDMTDAYDRNFIGLFKRCAKDERIKVREGVYAAMTGPSYETPAEIRMLEKMGADAVGMSTVPEVIMARRLGLRVAGLSVITNRAAGITGKPLNHSEVMESSHLISERMIRLVGSFVRELENA